MNAQTFYCDAQVYDEFVRDQQLLARLHALIHERVIRVFSSVELVEELTCIADSEQRRQILEVHWSLVGWNVLDYAFQLFERELRKGTRLSYDEALVKKEITAQIRDAAQKSDFASELLLRH